ncbi:DNA topoisomerase IV [Flavobacterium cyanobacteriorum]|uniref:DNA topoisomerase IV n=1 Tax=Flavobacterium cyanobacteriorum TaxID=2022802 RepID=A0A255ZKS2_9FLAO|nr:DNA topoisomerase IV [Flavobacterium cyanobacteriorum]OYQ42021.1 DNA topoisomerase IV [Flavobacterium cyanobacteriorum]
MKHHYLLLLCLIVTGCYQQERNCSNFKTGKFSFEYEINGKKKITLFERTETIEIETFEGKTDTASIRWVNDCEYILQKINPKNMQEKKAVHMKILTTNKNSYTFEYSFVGDTQKQKGTVTKIN